MKRLILTLAMTITLTALLLASQAAAQVPPPAKRAKHVRLVEAPQVELSMGHLTIIRWTTRVKRRRCGRARRGWCGV